jgi:muramoyltetrapeptide carboxypeptidase
MVFARVKREAIAVKKAPVLKHGDRVGLICPGGRPDNPAVVEKAVRLVKEMGLTPVLGDHVLGNYGCMSGKDEERLSDLQTMLEDHSVRGIFCITGGYGSVHLLPINYADLSANPKIIVGCDDNTLLLNAVHLRTGLITFHGPNLDQIKSRFTFDRFKAALMSKHHIAAIACGDTAPDEVCPGEHYAPVKGIAEGRLIGGNLTALVTLPGTPFEPEFADRILFLEDKNEQNGILDRWFTTLYLAGHLQSAAGVCFGSFENCSTRQSFNMLSVVDTFGDRLQQLGKISCFGLPFGQSKDTCIMPIGVNARLDAGAGRLEFLEPVVD